MKKHIKKTITVLSIIFLLVNLFSGCGQEQPVSIESSDSGLQQISVTGGYTETEIPIHETGYDRYVFLSLRTMASGDVQAIIDASAYNGGDIGRGVYLINTYRDGQLINSHQIINDTNYIDGKYYYENLIADDDGNLYCFALDNDYHQFLIMYSPAAESMSGYDAIIDLGYLSNLIPTSVVTELVADGKSSGELRYSLHMSDFCFCEDKVLFTDSSADYYSFVYDITSQKLTWLENVNAHPKSAISSCAPVSDGTVVSLWDGNAIKSYSTSNFEEIPEKSNMLIYPVFNSECGIHLCGLDDDSIYYLDSLGINRVLFGGVTTELILDADTTSSLSSLDKVSHITMGDGNNFYVAHTVDQTSASQELTYLKYDRTITSYRKPVLTVLDMFGYDETSILEAAVTAEYPDLSVTKQIITFENRGIYGGAYGQSAYSYEQSVEDYKALQDQIIQRISSGSGPDIIIADAQTIKILGEQGYLLDLSANGYPSGVPSELINSFSANDKIYAYPLVLQEAAFISTGNGSFDTSSVEAFTESVVNNTTDDYPFYFDNYISMFEQFYMLNQSELFKDGTFNRDNYLRFLQMMSAIATSISTVQQREGVPSYKEALAQGDPYGGYKLREGDKIKGASTEYVPTGTISFGRNALWNDSLYLIQYNNGYTIRPAYDLMPRSPLFFESGLVERLDYDYPEHWDSISPAQIPTMTTDPFVVPVAIAINANTSNREACETYIYNALDKDYQRSLVSNINGLMMYPPLSGTMPVNQDALPLNDQLSSIHDTKIYDQNAIRIDSVYTDLGDVQIIDHILMWNLAKIADSMFDGTITVEEVLSQSAAFAESYLNQNS